MNKADIKIFHLYILMSLLFIVLTTNYLSLNDIIFLANQTDVISYSEIAKIAPTLPLKSEIIIQHVAQRFFVPYFVGSIANFLKIDFFLVFQIFTFVLILFYIFLIYKIVIKLNFNLRISILFFTLLFFNPYIVRSHIFNPVQAHDMLFFCLGLIFAFSLYYNKFLINLSVTLISIYLRQSSIALFIGSSFFLIKKKKIILFLLLFFLYFISLFLITKIGEKISKDTFPFNLAYGILYYDFSQVNKLFKFILLGLMPFLPLGVIVFGSINKKIEVSNIAILLFVCAMLIGQPFLGGPDNTVNNVGRIANLSYPILTFISFKIWNFDKITKKDSLFYIFILGMFFWSLHPTYSIFKFFEFLRFYNF